MKIITDFNVAQKKVLVRCDFNVPVDKKGNILDDFRIKKTLPTIEYLIKAKAKIVLLSHLGEPNGQIIETLRLNHVKERLEKLLGAPVIKTDDCVGQEVKNQAGALLPGQILLLENVRFHQQEMDNDAAFARQLSEFGEIFINDAFGNCHRAHASMVGIPKFLPGGAGLLLQSEIENLNKVLQKPAHPLVVLVGGIKVATKSAFIEKISHLADDILVSGLIKKEIDHDKLSFSRPEKIISPVDDLEAPDISGKTTKMFAKKILASRMVVWNGPFGKYEDKKYKKGTLALSKAIIKSRAFSVAGGGETVAFLHQEGMLDKFSHVSTGGGAMLEFLSGQGLPGLKALN